MSVSGSVNKVHGASPDIDNSFLKSSTYTDANITLSHYSSSSAATRRQRSGNGGENI